MMRKVMLLLLVMILGTLITGCEEGTVEMTLKSDGSCNLLYILKADESLTVSVLRENIAKEIEKRNKVSRFDIYQLDNIRQKGVNLEISVNVKDVNATNNGDYLGSLKEYIKYHPSEKHPMIKSGEKEQVELSEINKKGNYKLLKISTDVFKKATVNLPYKVCYVSANAQFINEKQVKISAEDTYILMESGDIPFWAFILVAFALLIPVVVFIRRKKGNILPGTAVTENAADAKE